MENLLCSMIRAAADAGTASPGEGGKRPPGVPFLQAGALSVP